MAEQIASLALAAKRLKAGKFEPALSEMLAVWRATRNSALGLSLCRIAARVRVPLVSTNPWELGRMPKGEARLHACLTLLETLRRDDDGVRELLRLGALNGADPRVAAVALPLIFDAGARWSTREEACRAFSAAADVGLVRQFRELSSAAPPPPQLELALGVIASAVEQSLAEPRLLEPLTVELERRSEEIGQAFVRHLQSARERTGEFARERARRVAAVPELMWARPELNSCPRQAASHLLDSPIVVSKATVVGSKPVGEAAGLLSQWRATHDPELANQLDALDIADRAALRKSSRGKVRVAWPLCAAAKDVHSTGWLAEALFSDLVLADVPYFAFELDEPEAQATDGLVRNPNFVRDRFGDLFGRFDALAEMLPDPRAATQLVDWATRPVLPKINEPEVAERLVQLVEAAGDPRQAAALSAALVRQPWKRVGDRAVYLERLPTVVEKLRALNASTPSASSAVAKPKVDQETLDALMTAVLQVPADDAPRHVLADWLLERGFSRGEFIALQLRDATHKVSEVESRRLNILGRANREEWLGPLARVLKTEVWSRGFLVEASLRQNAEASSEIWAMAARHPALELVTTLHQGDGSVANYLLFLDGGRLLNLGPQCVPPLVRKALARKRKASSA